jgi:hypothetical protein
MRYYLEDVKIMDHEKEDGNRRTALCCDIKTAEELCFYLNEVHHDRKKKEAKSKEPIIMEGSYAY